MNRNEGAMLVHIPEKWKHLRQTLPGAFSDRLISFVDFAPTVLGLVGVQSPEYMQGLPFIGSNSNMERKYVHGNRDRVDEVFDCSRSVRNKRWLYIRNYNPHLSWSQPSVFSDLGEIRHEISQKYNENIDAATKAQKHFSSANKPIEELYDCDADPDNVRNLISTNLNIETNKVLEVLRKELIDYRDSVDDLGALPESEMRRWVDSEESSMRDIVIGKTDHSNLKRAWAAADLVGSNNSEKLLDLLKSKMLTKGIGL